MNPSVSYIKASDGSGNASLMTITQVRTAPATTITVNTVTGAPTKFFATMGTPHTFNDPVTGETITVISEASAVDFAGHIDSGKVEIDAIADGQTDLGSKVGDIIVIRPNTPWADNLHDVIAEAHQDSGKLKTTSLDEFYKPSEVTAVPFVASGGVIAQTTGLTATFSNIVYYINGQRYSKTSVANKTFSASKDTYVDIGIDGTVDYNEVANGAAAPAVAADHIRLALVVTNGSAITRIQQYGTDNIKQLIYNQQRGYVRRDSVVDERDAGGWGPGGGTSIVPNSQYTLKCQGGRDVLAFFTCTKVFLTAGTVTIDVWMDGVRQGEIARTSNSNGAVSGMFRVANVPPGDHVFDIRTTNAGGAYQFLQFNSQGVAFWEA